MTCNPATLNHTIHKIGKKHFGIHPPEYGAHAKKPWMCDLLTRHQGEPVTGDAYYHQAELRRLAGNF